MSKTQRQKSAQTKPVAIAKPIAAEKPIAVKKIAPPAVERKFISEASHRANMAETLRSELESFLESGNTADLNLLHSIFMEGHGNSLAENIGLVMNNMHLVQTKNETLANYIPKLEAIFTRCDDRDGWATAAIKAIDRLSATPLASWPPAVLGILDAIERDQGAMTPVENFLVQMSAAYHYRGLGEPDVKHYYDEYLEWSGELVRAIATLRRNEPNSVEAAREAA